MNTLLALLRNCLSLLFTFMQDPITTLMNIARNYGGSPSRIASNKSDMLLCIAFINTATNNWSIIIRITYVGCIRFLC
jgi:hypothetical protein